MTDFYWVNAASNNLYNDSSNWSTGDGGAGGDGTPGQSDNAWFTNTVNDDCTVDNNIDISDLNYYYPK